jgi:beta-lactamase regulating signal transducer with metallopeptidase domain
MSAILASLNAFSAAGLTAVLNTLWLALAVAAVLWCTLRLMPRVNAATRHAVWWAVLVLVVLLPFATLFVRPMPTASSPVRTEGQIQTRVLPSAIKPGSVTGTHRAAPPLLSVPDALPSRATRVPRMRLPFEVHPGNWPTSLLFLWMGISAVLLVRIMRSYFNLRGLLHRSGPASTDLIRRFGERLRDSGTSRVPRLLVSNEVISPFAAGFLHPMVILPEIFLEEIEEPELDYVLVHELAHIARHDDWTNLISRLASAVLVLHPVAAWILGRIQREREIACDDWVVAQTGSAVPYAVTLARLSEFCSTRRRELLATGMASANLSKRIEILLRPRSQCSRAMSLSRVSVSIAAALTLVSLGVRMPGWIALAKDAAVPGTQDQATPKLQISVRPIGLAPESSLKAAAQLVATISPAEPTQSAANDSDKTWRHEWKLTREGSSTSQVQLSLISRDDDGNDRTNTQGVPLSSLAGFSLSMLDQDGPVKFEYVRKAGSIACEGRAAHGRASGPFKVTLNPSFVSALEKMGYAAPHDEEAFSLVTSDVTLGYAQAVRDTELTSSISDLVELEDHGVSSDYVRAIRQEGFTDLSAQNISSLRDHGVEPNYLKAIKAAGPKLSIEEIDSLRDHGVKPEYFKSMEATAPQLSIEKIDCLFDPGVEPDSYKGYASVDPKLSIEEIDSLRDHGVKPEYYRSLKSVDPNLSIEKIDSLHDHGVEPDSYKGYASVDPKLSIEEIDSLGDHGVKPEYYRNMKSVDLNLSIEKIDSLHDHGVEPEFYRGIKSADSSASIEEIDRLRDHGVEPEYLRDMRALPDQFSIADVAELRDHGITAKYIRNLHNMGMKNLKASQIVHLREGGD